MQNFKFIAHSLVKMFRLQVFVLSLIFIVKWSASLSIQERRLSLRFSFKQDCMKTQQFERTKNSCLSLSKINLENNYIL